MSRETLFEIPYDPDWGYERSFFLDNELRYTKMHRLLRESLGDLAGRRVLDLGCCRGLLLERFRAYPGIELVGLEIDQEETRLAQRRGLNPVRHHINRFDGDRMVASLPFVAESADIVLAGEILEHIVDTEGFLREIRRVLVPGGAVCLSTPNILWLKHRLGVLRGRYPDALDYRLRYGDDFGHVRLFGPEQLRSLLAETGFSDVRVVGKRLGPISSLETLAAAVLDRAADRLPGLSDNLIAVALRA
ncbi:MAG: methyltransferase domain-containing protein [Actinobacteria bacterium]|nr:methyltransferase domain-containing protein [Actinomycetota bacterium]